MKKLSIIFVMLVMILSFILIITPDESVVNADPPTVYEMDYDYIYEITDKLSEIINLNTVYPEYELAKGRYYGSKGEREAALYLASQMSSLGLYDPTSSSSPSYREQIKNITENLYRKFFQNEIIDSDSFESIYEILNRELIINKPGGITSEDCYISPCYKYNDNWIKEEPRWFNYSNVNIIKVEDYDCNDSFLSKIKIKLPGHWITGVGITEENLTILNQWSLLTATQLMRPFLIQRTFEKHYDFRFILMKPWLKCTWPSYLRDKDFPDNNFVFIEENPGFNPGMKLLPSIENSNDYNSLHYWTAILRSKYRELREKAWDKAYNGCFIQRLKGIIKYDYLDDAFDTGNLGVGELPLIFINNITGQDMYDNADDYTIDFNIHQKLNTSVLSYNVIGQIEGVDTSKTVILGCLYDSMWCQGTVDSAIGVGIMLAIAKYFDQNEIKPKYNLRFIAYGGEEVGIRGAYYYELAHRNDSDEIVAVIDLNQFGYVQDEPGIHSCHQL